jgi:hypothetical protein
MIEEGKRLHYCPGQESPDFIRSAVREPAAGNPSNHEGKPLEDLFFAAVDSLIKK